MLTVKVRTKFKISTQVKAGLLLLIVVSVAVAFTMEIPILRYVKYLIFPALIAINFLQEKPVLELRKVDIDFYRYTQFWLVVSFLSILSGVLLNGVTELNLIRAFKEFYFINTAFFSVLLLFNVSSVASIEKALKYFIGFSCVAVFVLGFSQIVALISYEFSLLYFIKTPTENYISSIYGATFLYFLMKKDWKMAIICFIITIIGGKRIIYASVLASVVVYFVLNPFQRYILKIPSVIIFLAITANLLIASLLYVLSQGYLDSIILELTGIPPNWIFSGRIAMYKDVFDYIDTLPLLPNGLGYIGTLLVDKEIHYNDFFIHMHSDVLKYVIEFGIILFIVIFVYTYKLALKNFSAFIIIVYFNIFMLTDNPSILYEFNVYFFIILMLALLQSKEHTSRQEIETVNHSLFNG